MEVKFLDLASIHQPIRNEIISSFENSLEKSDFILSKETIDFENEFSNFLGAKFCISVGNGLDALKISLVAAGVEKGDEVLVPGHTFIATWLAVSEIGAIPIPVDCDLKHYNISVTEIEGKISPRTRAILPVHMYGNPCELNEINAIAKRNNLVVIEDAAQAHGARYRGLMIGTKSIATCFSFYPGKNLGCLGDGGAISTNDENLAKKVRKLRNYGSTEKYIHEEKGFNSRLDSIQAGFLRVKLPLLSHWNEIRRNTAKVYFDALKNLESISLPTIAAHNESAWHLYVIRTKYRDQLSAFLKTKGISKKQIRPKIYHNSLIFNAFPPFPFSFLLA